MTVTERIEINPKVMMGKPVIRGTRRCTYGLRSHCRIFGFRQGIV